MIRKILTGKAIASIGVVTLISAGDPDRQPVADSDLPVRSKR